MAKNEGGVDRIVRAIVGAVLIIAAFFLAANGLTVLFYVVGVMFVITAMTGFCALYKIPGIDTSKK
jgi:predicted phage tail protein